MKIVKAKSKVTKKIDSFTYTNTVRPLYVNMVTGASYGQHSFEYMYDIIVNETKDKIREYFVSQKLPTDLIDKMTEDIYNLSIY